MTVAASLRASSAAFYRAGQEFSAIMAKEMAAQCERTGESGEALYRHWADELAERADKFTRDGGLAQQAPAEFRQQGKAS